MNVMDLVRNKGLFALLIGATSIAIVGGLSVAYADTTGTNQTSPQIQGSINLQQIIQSNVKTSFIDAANTALGAVPNGKIIGGSLTMVQGSVVYQFQIVDDQNMSYSVIVDAGNNTVLYTSPGHAMKFGGFGLAGHGKFCHGMKGGFHHMGGFWNKQAPSGDTTSSGSTSPTSDGIGLPTGLRV